jgi:hypothetical protein
VGAIADRVFVAHASPGSKTLSLCQELSALGKPIVTIDDPRNKPLLQTAQLI